MTPQLGHKDDFSLVLGGPLFQLFRRMHLTGNALELVRRRIVVIAFVAWVPLLVLSFVDGKAAGTAVKLPFLYDVDAYVRFLVALPLLIAAELIVHERMRAVVGQFVSQGLVPDQIRERFEATIASALRLRNSVLAEVLLIAFVYIVGILVLWRFYIALDVPTWYATPEAGRLWPQLAGWWYFFVSVPLFQFILLRWYFRLFIWTPSFGKYRASRWLTRPCIPIAWAASGSFPASLSILATACGAGCATRRGAR
ncbi:MAG TPA: hypothetical protein VGL25_14095 [Casimicrobiaceae bacterium]